MTSTRPGRALRLLREAALSAAALVGVLVLAGAVLTAVLDVHLLLFRSGSMTPAIGTGAVAISREVPARDVAVGDVVSVRTGSGARVTHRVVDIATSDRPDGAVQLRLQGDANEEPDTESYQVTEVLRVAWSVPWVGRLVAWLSGPTGLLVLGAYAMGMVLLLLRPGSRPVPPGPGPGGGASGGGRHRGVAPAQAGTRSRVLRGAVLAGSVLLTSQVAAPAGAAWVDPAGVSAGLRSNPWFSCGAGVAAASGAAPFLWYRLDEVPVLGLLNPPTAVDSSGNLRNGTYSGATLDLPSGRTYQEPRACVRDTGTAVRFDGSVGRLTSPSFARPVAGAVLDTLTVATWFRTTSTAGGRLVGLGQPGPGASAAGTYDRMLYLGPTGTVSFAVAPGGTFTTITSPTAWNDGAWHLAVATLAPSGATVGARLYVDGTLVASAPGVTGGRVFASAGTAAWRIAYDVHAGALDLPTSNFLAATLDDVAVWSGTALSPTTIAALHRAGR